MATGTRLRLTLQAANEGDNDQDDCGGGVVGDNG